MGKISYHEVSPAAAEKMKAEGFVIGKPTKAGWYLVAVRTKDDRELYWVLQLWFNPMATPQWWTGGGYVSDISEAYRWQDGVRAYRKLPNVDPGT